MLLDAAAEAGVDVRQRTAVQSIDRLADGDVAVTAGGNQITAKLLIDASGQGTVVGRHQGTRRVMPGGKVAHYGHFEHVKRLGGDADGHPTIVWCAEGWFWLININPTQTSVGFVAAPELGRTVNVAPDRLLRWAIDRCPIVRDRMEHADGPATNGIAADFSYACRPYAGPGYFLVGDAACFLDPIFSTGVTFAIAAAVACADDVISAWKGDRSMVAARRRHRRFVTNSTAPFWRLIRNSYRHGFRELALNATGPLQLHKAVISTLAGNVFPRPPWPLRWRLRVFDLCCRLQKHLPLVPHRPAFSLLGDAADRIPEAAVLATT